MLIGVPKEIKNREYRVGLTPSSVRELTHRNHGVVIESGAGLGIGFTDQDYIAMGAKILPSASEVFAQAEMIVKVKEPQASERAMLKPHHLLFTYLHLAPDAPQTDDLLKSGATCIAYETITDAQGRLPLLAPMSEVAGRLSIQAGAHCLEKAQGGRGLLLGGVAGVPAANVVIIGGGVVGQNAIAMAVGLGSQVTVLDNNLDTLRHLDQIYSNRISTLYSNRENIENQVILADLVIGSVLIPGAAAPKLVTADHIKRMKAGAAVVDVAIDQGGCFETSKATTHDNPTYLVDEVVHYCVANMPGAAALTASLALNNATLPFVLQLANQGAQQALLNNPHLMKGLNVCRGQLTYQAVAQAQNLNYTKPEDALRRLS